MVLLAALVAVLLMPHAASALPAFPGAEGFGSTTPGGRGGSVVEVTSLADAGAGTLRAALEDVSGPRTVVFRVAGTITLTRAIQLRGASGSFVTVAGQTAPGDGIQLANYGLQIRDGAHDIVLRYLRIRPSNGSGDFVHDIDAIELWGNAGTQVRNVVVDHCSLQWAMDENFSAWGDVADVTVQRSLIAEAVLDGQGHGHAKGVLVGAESSDPKPDRFAFHHDVFAHNPDRNPRLAYATTDFRNNVVYDWGGNNSTLFGPYGGFPAGAKPTDVNLIGNLWKRGPASRDTYLDAVWLNANTRVFPAGNWGTQCPAGCGDEWALGFREEFGGYDLADPMLYRATAPFTTPWVTTYPAASLTTTLLANVGASLPARDAVDARIVADVVAGTGTTGQGSGYPVLAMAPAPADGDHDGMPDDWELAHGLAPADPSDRNDDADGDGYTNLEEYLAALGPSEFGCGDGLTHAGEACDDGNRVDGDGCDANCTVTACGNGIPTAGEACDDGNLVGGDCCDAACQFEPAATSCDDGSLCTPTDACDGAGQCVGSETPALGCRTAAKGSLQLDAARGKINWKWLAGAATTVADLGDPVQGGTFYALCVYDRVSGVPQLRMQAALPPGAARWKAQSGGLKYRSKLATPNGIATFAIKAGAAGKSRIGITGKGAMLPVPALPFDQQPAVTVQLRNDTGACWTQDYSAPACRNDAAQFKDAAD